jgi:hypothetical protein
VLCIPTTVATDATILSEVVVAEGRGHENGQSKGEVNYRLISTVSTLVLVAPGV